MSNPSNLYAEKVFAEYPLEMWSLDDATDFASLITNSQRDITLWTPSLSVVSIDYETEPDTITNISSELDIYLVSDYSEEPPPIDDIDIYQIDITPEFGFTSGEIILTSNTTFDVGSQKEFAISVPMLADQATTSVEIGYKIGSTITWSEEIFTTKDFLWSVPTATFSGASAIGSPANIVFKISFSQGTNSPGVIYKFYVGGISVGVRSEEFAGSSLGLTPEDKPAGLPLTGSTVKVVKANPYSLSDNYGYYTVDNGIVLRARNSTIPLVYGASNSTILSKADNGNPSLIVPGTGFLNDSGKLFTRTLEFWMRLNVSASSYRRIVGPVSTSSLDGLYVNGPFMSLKVGDSFGSYFVGEWSRPMLVQIILQDGTAVLKVNSETVVSLNVNISQQDFPGADEDWIGFYAYDDVTEFEVDCVAIYSYSVSDKISKKRFVYGQGVVLPDSTNTAYGGSSIVADYSFANYDKNHSFPKNTDWTSGIYKNLYVDKQRLSLPDYQLPTANFGKNTFEEWLRVMQGVAQDPEMKAINRGVFYMKPTYHSTVENALFDLNTPYFSFDNLNVLTNSKVSGMYFIFENNNAGSDTDRNTLFLIQDYLTGKSLEISASSNSIRYVLNDSAEPLLTHQVIPDGEYTPVKTVAGIDIKKLSATNPDIASLFSEPSRLRVSVGGSINSTVSNLKTFTGPIYEFGFLSDADISNLGETAFDSNGFADYAEVETFESITPEYSVVGKYILDTFSLDVACKGSWQDFVPVSMFKKVLTLSDGSEIDDVSMIQVNVDYPAIRKFVGGNYDTSNSFARFFISFQNMSDGVVLSSGRSIVPMGQNDYVSPSSSWESETYEIVDGVVLGMPNVANLDEIAMIFSVEIESDGIRSNPVVIRSIDLASLTFDEQSLRPIGTKYGTKIYPFKELDDEEYASSKTNPFKVYKGTTPYLYLTSKTGIEVVGDILPPTDPEYVHRGVVAIINESLSETYDVSSIMMSLRYQDREFPTTKTTIFEIEGKVLDAGAVKDIYLRFFVESINYDNTRGKIFCEASIDGEAFSTYDNLVYYWNGKVVGNPVLSANEWGMLSVSFTNFLKFPAVSGSFEIHGKVIVDNVSIYKISATESQSSTTTNTWNSALYNYADWEAVSTDGTNPILWSTIYIIVKTATKPVDQSEIYRSYLGINKIIVDTSDSSVTLKPENCEYVVYNAVEWKTTTLNAL